MAEQIMMHIAAGTPIRAITHMLKISNQTLYKHYQEAIDLGEDVINAKVVGKLYQAIDRNESWAIKTYLNNRVNAFSPKLQVEAKHTHTTSNINLNVEAKLENLSVEQIQHLRGIMETLGDTGTEQAPIDDANVIEFPA